jgi:N-acetylglucosamine kinase-like BadF-type ATPase
MAYFLGVDGGNSKTQALVITDEGNVLGFGAGGGSDYQEFGLNTARRAWEQAMNEALKQAGLQKNDFAFGSFCLAGADMPEDYRVLEAEVSKITQPMPIIVKNDSIAALRADLQCNTFGVTVVLGTGFNAAGRGKDGKEIVLPGLGYISGDYGGGRWIARQMIRAIMRAWDGRGQATTMRDPILETMCVKDETELIYKMRKEERNDRVLDLVPILFDAAYLGDEVAQSIVTFIGIEVGITASTLIRRLDLQDEEVPVILSTSVFRGKGPLLLDVIAETVHRVAPRARILTPDIIPVVGAALVALECAGYACSPDLLEKLHKEFTSHFPELVRNALPLIP